MTVSTSTMFYPPVLLKTAKYIPHPSQMHKARPVRLVHPHQRPPNAIVFTPAESPLDPQRYAPLRAPAQTSSSGCGAFVDGNEHVEKGNCFVEAYENGYRDEESKKTFYGDGNSNVNTEKHGERNTQNYRNEAVYHHESKHRAPAPVGRDHQGGGVKVKKYRTHYQERDRVPVNQGQTGRPDPQNYRNEAGYHYPDKKRIPIPENNENSLATQATTLPPKKEGEDDMDDEIPTKAVYFKPLKNGKMKFIVRPADIKYVKVHDGSKLKPGEDIKLVEITKSRRVLPAGTKIDTVKIVQNTEPRPEGENQSEESSMEGSRKVRQKSRPLKSYKNVKVREKITRLITPKKTVKSETKVNPLWVQNIRGHKKESGEDDDYDTDPDKDDISMDPDSLDEDDGYKVHEEQAEASEVPSLTLTSPAEELVVRVKSRRRKPRQSVKYGSSDPSFADSWVAAQTEIAKRISEYWHTNSGDTKPKASFYGNKDSKPIQTSSAYRDPKPRFSGLKSSGSKPKSSFFSNADTKSSDTRDTIHTGLAPRSFGAPFEFAVSDSSERSGKPLNDLFEPSSMQKEFFPTDPTHPVVSGKGKSEQAVAGGEFETSAEDVFADLPPLSKILSTKGHVFKPAVPPSPKGAFGATDPDRLESDLGVPVVEESSHKRKGYKETREHQLKTWR